MTNQEKLKELLLDIFLLEPENFRFNLMRDEVETWDSLGIVAMAVGVHEAFGYHFTPEEAIKIRGIQDIINTLSAKGISFDAVS